MLNLVVRMPAKRPFVIWSVCIVSVLVILSFVMQGGIARGGFDSYAEQIKYAEKLGWQISEKPISVKKVTVADQFDENLKKYNEIQLSQGYDLKNFCGCELTRYTYLIYNYPNSPDGMRLSFMVYDGNIVAADIQSTTDSGFMHGIEI